MNTGIKGEKKFTVTKEQLACNVGSGLVSVFATPMMIAAIENTAAGSVAGELEEGRTTVGTLVNVSHVAATPEGMEVRIETELTEIAERQNSDLQGRSLRRGRPDRRGHASARYCCQGALRAEGTEQARKVKANMQI